MAPPRKTHCKRGHRFTASTTKMVKLQTGYLVRQCRLCRSERNRLEYRNNPIRQAKVRHRARIQWELRST